MVGGELLGLVDVSGDLPECAVFSLISTGFSKLTKLEFTSVYTYLTSLKLPPNPKL